MYVRVYRNGVEVLRRYLGKPEYAGNDVECWFKIGQNSNYKYAYSNNKRYIMLLDNPKYNEYLQHHNVDPIVFIYDTNHYDDPDKAFTEPSSVKHLKFLATEIKDIVLDN
jgi:hypothetical protein